MIYFLQTFAAILAITWLYFFIRDKILKHIKKKSAGKQKKDPQTVSQKPAPASQANKISNNTTNEKPQLANQKAQMLVMETDEYKVRLLSDDALEIVRYTGDVHDLVIPDKLNGKTITSIGEEAFYDNKELISVTIPDTITSIGKRAFSKTGITAINIPENVTNIGPFAFSHTKLMSITIPSRITEIETDLFNDCSNLVDVILPEGLRSIGSDAFMDCKSLKSIAIPESVLSIGAMAFYGCENLEEINLPPELKEIEAYTFAKCKALNSVSIPDGVLIIGNGAFRTCESLKTFHIPDDLLHVGDAAFEGCKNLTDHEIIGRLPWSALCPELDEIHVDHDAIIASLLGTTEP